MLLFLKKNYFSGRV